MDDPEGLLSPHGTKRDLSLTSDDRFSGIFFPREFINGPNPNCSPWFLGWGKHGGPWWVHGSITGGRWRTREPIHGVPSRRIWDPETAMAMVNPRQSPQSHP